ncbi:hypothetical protein [Streptosporangium sp. NPDC023615]|uniref:hypothetical protein n=1 Tax=Streptosporangium sp. NPDC023615 TaxID=3154794 RepID=UPI00343F02AC
MNGWKENWRRTRVEALQGDYLPGWYATRRRRRLLAAAAAFGVSLFWVDAAVAWISGPGDGPVLVNIVLLTISLIVYLPAVSLLNVATRGVVELSEGDLDERQVGERLRATALAHRIMTGVLITLLVVVLVVGIPQKREFFMPGGALVLLTIALFMTHFVLPLIVSGWRLPDPPPDDDA